MLCRSAASWSFCGQERKSVVAFRASPTFPQKKHYILPLNTDFSNFRLRLDSKTESPPRFVAESDVAFQPRGPYLHPKASSMHPAGLIQLMGFYVSIVRWGIMLSDLLHVQSFAFEGLGDFENIMLSMCFHLKTRFSPCCSWSMSFNMVSVIDSRLPENSLQCSLSCFCFWCWSAITQFNGTPQWIQSFFSFFF